MTNPLFNTNTSSSNTSTKSDIKPIKIEDFNDEFDPNSGWLLLLYGAFGSGKTFFCGTARDSLYVNTGSGEDTLRSPLFKSKYPNINRKYVEIVSKKDRLGFDYVCDTMQTIIDDAELREQIRTIILDDATALRSMAMAHGMDHMKKDISKFIDSDMSDIKREMDRINWFLSYHLPVFKSLGINFILTAHESRIYGKAKKMGEERPLLEIRPGFAGEKFPDAVPSKFDEVWHISLKRSEREGEYSQIKTGGGGVEVTRTRRAGVFPNFIQNQDFEQLLQMRKENKIHPSFRSKL